MDPIGLTLKDLATQTRISQSTLSRLINGKTGITTESAYRLAMALDTTPLYWLNLNKAHELSKLRANEKFMNDLSKLKPLNS